MNEPCRVMAELNQHMHMLERKSVTTITRSKLYPTPGKNYRLAWKWHYEVNGNHGCDTLAQARNIARKLYPGQPIIEAWKAEAVKS